MNTKLSQIEKSLKLKYRLENGGDQGRNSNGLLRASTIAGGSITGESYGQPRNRENEELIMELQRYNGVLLRDNGELKARVKVNEIFTSRIRAQYGMCHSRCLQVQ